MEYVICRELLISDRAVVVIGMKGIYGVLYEEICRISFDKYRVALLP